MQATLGLLALIVLLAPLAVAATHVGQAVALQPACKAAPVTLAAGAEGTTAVGASGTSATTAYTSRPQTRTLLVLTGVSGTWNVTLRHVASSFQATDAVTVGLSDGVTAVPQVQVALGAPVLATGTPLPLSPGGTLQVQVTGNLAGNNVRTLDLRIVMQGDGTVVEYAYHLDLT